MSIPYFYSDLHGGHKNIMKYRKQFRDEQDHWEYCEEEYKKLITKRDVVYCLGDMCFTEERLKEFSTWPGRKILVCGNHDRDRIPMQSIVDAYDEVYALYKYKQYWLSHAPIHPQELRGKYNLHGHVHYYTVEDWRYFNCCLENIDMKPISLMEVNDIFSQRKKWQEGLGYV